MTANTLLSEALVSNFFVEKYTNNDYDAFETKSIINKQTTATPKTNTNWIQEANRSI